MFIRGEVWEVSTICHFLNSLVCLHKDEAGQGLVEYLLILALVAFGAIAAMKTMASSISNAFGKINSKLTSAIS